MQEQAKAHGVPPAPPRRTDVRPPPMQQHAVRVTVKRGEIVLSGLSSHFIKMDLYVEVLLGERMIATVPPRAGADRLPSWDYTLNLQEFFVGDVLHFKVWDKNHWPRKDVHVGTGSLPLTAERLAKGPLEQMLNLSRPQNPGQTTGTVEVHLAFPKMVGAAGSADALLSNHSLQADDRSALLRASAQGSGASSSTTAADRSGTMRSDLGAARRTGESLIALPSTGVDGHHKRGDGGSIVGGEAMRAEDRQHLVDIQYWERDVIQRRHHALLCTDGVKELFRERQCQRRCGCAAVSCSAGLGVVACFVLSALHL